MAMSRKILRRRFLHLAAGAGGWLGMCQIARAQAYPTRPITIVDTFPPGGSTGLIARIIADKLSETLGWQVVVDQRGGAAGTIAARQYATDIDREETKWSTLVKSLGLKAE
jgi:tripartite-type tricarboxylate transporter receptor subunit TctC